MDLEFSAEQEELRSAVREVLSRECPTSVPRDLVETGKPADALWATLGDLGWPALTLPEEVGGLGFGPVETAVVAEELGRALAPVPWLSTVTQYAAAVREAGSLDQRAALLEPIASGAATGTLAVAEDARHALPRPMSTTARRVGAGWVLRGEKRFVWDAVTATEIAVVADVDGHLGVFVVPASQLEPRPLRTLDATRTWCTVTLDDVEIPDERALQAGTADEAVRRAVEEATAAVALEMIGVCDAMLAMTLAHVRTREQFGVPIGSFQAVKHKLADCYVALERARAAAYYAAATLAEDDPGRSLAVASAKAAAGGAQRRVVQDAIQSFGGIGYTWEHDLQLFAKRAKADEAVFGTSAVQRSVVAELIGLPTPG